VILVRVVVGYAVQKKATLTGAVEQISAKTFESRALTNVGLALRGVSRPGVTRTSPRPAMKGELQDPRRHLVNG